MTRARIPRGTTLLEVLVALLVTGAVAGIGASAFEQLTARRAQLLAVSAATEQASATRALLQRWLDAAEVETPVQTANVNRLAEQIVRMQAQRTARGAAPVIPPPEPVARQAGDELFFTTAARTPLDGRDVRVRLYVDADEATPERGLAVELQHALFGSKQRTVLDPEVRAMRVTYYAPAEDRWIDAERARRLGVSAARIEFRYDANDAVPLHQLPLTVVLSATAREAAFSAASLFAPDR